jgi:hypothetical protein
MMAFLLLVTWLSYGQPPSDYQVPFSSNEACEAARLQLIKDIERIGQSMIERATVPAFAAWPAALRQPAPPATLAQRP